MLRNTNKTITINRLKIKKHQIKILSTFFVQFSKTNRNNAFYMVEKHFLILELLLNDHEAL